MFTFSSLYYGNINVTNLHLREEKEIMHITIVHGTKHKCKANVDYFTIQK